LFKYIFFINIYIYIYIYIFFFFFFFFLIIIDFCKKCLNNFNGSYSEIMQNLNNLENKYNYIQKICRKCTNVTLDLDIENCCKSMDCPILYFKQHLKTKLKVMYQISNDFLNNI